MQEYHTCKSALENPIKLEGIPLITGFVYLFILGHHKTTPTKGQDFQVTSSQDSTANTSQQKVGGQGLGNLKSI